MSFFQAIKNAACQVIKAVQIKITNIILDLFWKYNYTMILIEDSRFRQYWKPANTKLVEPDFSSWICIASIENGKLLEKYVFTDSASASNDYTQELDGNSIMICKTHDGQRHVKTSHDDIVSGPSKVQFLSVLYDHPDIPTGPLRLAIDPTYMMVGNCLLNRIFVLRLLRYQYNKTDFVFDDRYKLIIMDSNIVVCNVDFDQGIILESDRYITSPPKN
jgi:hypothetical protein